jgi:uncharacterized membrane protein
LPGTEDEPLRSFAAVFVLLVLTLGTSSAHAQAQSQKPTQKSSAKTPAAGAQSDEVPSPVSKHYPILVIAHGNDPVWTLRLGMKGPERLDRANYPPIVLEPAAITNDDSGNSWTYNAKGVATNATVGVKLTREMCADGTSETKYTFRVELTHSQLGVLKGCGQSSPEQFPEFRKKNQIDAPDAVATDEKDKDKDKDKDKKTVLEPITKFTSPTAIAYLDATGKVIVAHGEVKKAAAPAGAEPNLSHDGKKLLYTRSDSKTGPERSIVQFDWDTGQSHDVAKGNNRQAFWSPDDSRVAFLKFNDQKWEIWTFPAGSPDKATQFSQINVSSLHGWTSPTTLLATDTDNAYWIGEDGKPIQTIPLKEIYGGAYDIMGSDTIRVSPVNPDLLLISAFYKTAPTGAPVDSMGLNSTCYLYEVRSKRSTPLCPPDAFSRAGEWSRDSLQVFFTRGVTGKGPLVTNRIFWDGSGVRRYVAGSDLVVGK